MLVLFMLKHFVLTNASKLTYKNFLNQEDTEITYNLDWGECMLYGVNYVFDHY